MLSLSTVRYISVNSKAAGYCSINCHTQFRNSRNRGDCTREDTGYTEHAGFQIEHFPCSSDSALGVRTVSIFTFCTCTFLE